MTGFITVAIVLFLGVGAIVAAKTYRKNKELREAAELEDAERLGQDAVKSVIFGRMAREARLIKATIYATLVAVAVIVIRLALGYGLYYGRESVHLAIEPFMMPFVPTAIILFILVMNTDFISLSEREEANLLKKYYVKQGLTEDGLTYEEAARRRDAENARAVAKAEAARSEAEGRAAYQVRQAEEARKAAAETEAATAVTKAKTEADAARLAAEEAERRKREEAEAEERAFWASPEGQKVKADKMRAEIEKQKALDLAQIRLAEQKEAAAIAERVAEAERQRRKEEMDAVKSFLE